MRVRVKNAASADQVQNARRLEADEIKQWASDLTAVATSDAGCRVLRTFLRWSGFLESGLGRTDSETNYRVGKRELGLQLLAELTDICPSALGAILITPEDA